MSKKRYSTRQSKRKHTKDEIGNIIKDERIKDLFNKIIEKHYSDKYSDKKSERLSEEKSDKYSKKFYEEEYSDNKSGKYSEEKSDKYSKEFYEEEYSDKKSEEYSEEKSKKHKKHRKHRKEKEFTTTYSHKDKKEKYSERHGKKDNEENSSKHEVIEVEEFLEESFEKRVEEDCTENKHECHHEHHSCEDHYEYDNCDKDCTTSNDCNDWTDEDYSCEDRSCEDITIECCEAEVDSETLSLCPNTELPVKGTTQKVVIKTPVVLAEPRINISLISSLKLEDPALEIKRIRKNVYLTQCKLIPNSGDGNPDYGVIFIEGFIRKNIEYATAECKGEGVVSGKIKHTTVKVPFRCTTRVKFTTRPIFTNNTPQNEVEIVQNSINFCDPCGESIMGINPCEQNSRFIEFFNEKVFCELVDTEILESDILQKPADSCCNSPIDRTFHSITEKVVLNITIKLLQNQQVLIN